MEKSMKFKLGWVEEEEVARKLLWMVYWSKDAVYEADNITEYNEAMLCLNEHRQLLGIFLYNMTGVYELTADKWELLILAVAHDSDENSDLVATLARIANPEENTEE